MKPSKKQFKQKIKSYDSESIYINWPELKKQALEQDIFYFSNTNEIKKRVIDSLKLLKEPNFIIVDVSKDYNGRRVDWSYFFFKNKIISGGYQELFMKTHVKFIPLIEEENTENLKKNGNNVLTAYNYFNKESLEKISGRIEFGSFVHFDVTVVVNEKIGFYNVRSDSTGYKVTRKM